ncbi:hypothetical protein Sste5346_007306 [Sporothrix stenoceras]|uniref:Single-strand DNA deaminase toxin A-like C-terminal domain-containing protein n=1 Tax=Sporothrix stenoceras TaxID=5173 RepID=A0ABR3YV25_9PEZI
MTSDKKSKLPKKKGNTGSTAKSRYKSDGDGNKKCKPKISFAWKDRGRKLVVMNELATAKTGLPGTSRIQATPACLIANGTSTPMKVCTSGWRKTPADGLNLDGEKWTKLVRDFCAVSNFTLRISVRDTPKSSERVPENEYRYDACHAEKKLGLYFFGKQMQFANMRIRDALDGQLLNAGLSDRRLGARIYLGHRPCKSCLDFLEHIRSMSGIYIKAVSCPVFAEHTRTRVFFNGTSTITGSFGGGGGPPDKNDKIKSLFGTDGHGSSSDEEDNDADDDDAAVKAIKARRSGDEADASSYEGDDDNEIVMSGDVESPDLLDAADEIIAGLPVGNIIRPRSPRSPCLSPTHRPRPLPNVMTPIRREPLIVPERQEEDSDSESRSPEPSVREQGVSAAVSVRSSVRSSPSPSFSLASVLNSSVIDPRDRFPEYTSPSRRGGSAAPPSIWGARHKPPTTPCLEPPDFGARQGNTTGGTNNGGVSSSWVAADNELSYFFGTPSAPSLLSDYAGPVEMSGAIAVAHGTFAAPLLVAESTLTPEASVMVPPPTPIPRVDNNGRRQMSEQPQTGNPIDLQLPPRTRLDILSEAAHAVSTGSVAQDLTGGSVSDIQTGEQNSAGEQEDSASSVVSVSAPSINVPAYLRQIARNQNANSSGNGATTTTNNDRPRQIVNGVGSANRSQFSGQAAAIIHAPRPRNPSGHSPVLATQTTFTVPVVDLTDDAEDRNDTASRLPFVRGQVENPWIRTAPVTQRQTTQTQPQNQTPAQTHPRPSRTQENQQPDVVLLSSHPALTRGVADIPRGGLNQNCNKNHGRREPSQTNLNRSPPRPTIINGSTPVNGNSRPRPGVAQPVRNRGGRGGRSGRGGGSVNRGGQPSSSSLSASRTRFPDLSEFVYYNGNNLSSGNDNSGYGTGRWGNGWV